MRQDEDADVPQSARVSSGAQDADRVDPATVHTAAELADALNLLRAGRPYTALDKAARPDRLPASTLSGLLKTGRPTAETLDTYLRACGVPREQWMDWQQARIRASTEAPSGLDGLKRVERTDPRRLGVHAAIDALGAIGELPGYIERDVDSGSRGVRTLILCQWPLSSPRWRPDSSHAGGHEGVPNGGQISPRR